MLVGLCQEALARKDGLQTWRNRQGEIDIGNSSLQNSSPLFLAQEDWIRRVVLRLQAHTQPLLQRCQVAEDEGGGDQLLHTNQQRTHICCKGTGGLHLQKKSTSFVLTGTFMHTVIAYTFIVTSGRMCAWWAYRDYALRPVDKVRRACVQVGQQHHLQAETNSESHCNENSKLRLLR